MSQYTKTNWKKGDTISSERMNKIENELERLDDSTVIVDSSLSVSGAAADAKATGDEITNLKADLSAVNENALISIYSPSNVTLQSGRINATTGAITDANLAFKHITLQVQPKDIITFFSCLSGNGTPYGYAFYDSENTFISGAYVSNEEEKRITTPENASFFRYGMYNPKWDDDTYNVFKLLTSETQSIINGISKTENDDNAFSTIYTKDNATYEKGRINALTGAITESNLAFHYIELNVTNGDIISFYSTTVGNTTPYGCAFYDSENQYISGVVVSVEKNMFLEIPENAAFFRYGMHDPKWDDATYNKFTVVGKPITQIIGKLTHTGLYGNYSWNAVGDSITQQARYTNIIKDILRINYTNCGIGSSTIAVNNTYLTNQSIVERVCGLNGVTPYPNADIWTINGGLNDVLYKSALGAIAPTGSTFDTSTVYGALQSIVENIMGRSAQPRLILITPTHSVRDSWSKDTYGITIDEIRQAFINVGEYYGVPVIDLWKLGGINAYNMSKDTNPTTLDGVHPNDNGAKLMAMPICNAIKDLLYDASIV